MATLTSQDIADIVASTQYELGRLRFQQIAQNLVYYEVFTKWFRRDKVAFDSGIGIQRTLMNRFDASAASHVGLLEPDTVSISDVLDQLRVDWRYARTSYAMIYQTDFLQNRGAAQILNAIKPKRASALLALVEELENRAWAAPSVSDKRNPYGLPYWIVKNGTTGFNGGAVTGHSAVGGVSLTDSPTFKNYTALYAAVSKADLITKMRTAWRKIRFQSPVTIEDYRGSMGERYRLYVGDTLMGSIEDLGEAQNDNLGRDIAAMDGQMVFRKNPIIYVPKLDADTVNPLYMVDHSTFMPVCMKGDYLRESRAQPHPQNHNVFQVFIDLSYNYLCLDRRRNAVFATAATGPGS